MGLVFELKKREIYDSGRLAIENGIIGVTSNGIHYVDNGNVKYQKLPDKSIEEVGRNSDGGMVIYFADDVNYLCRGDPNNELVFSDGSVFKLPIEYVSSMKWKGKNPAGGDIIYPID